MLQCDEGSIAELQTGRVTGRRTGRTGRPALSLPNSQRTDADAGTASDCHANIDTKMQPFCPFLETTDGRRWNICTRTTRQSYRIDGRDSRPLDQADGAGITIDYWTVLRLDKTWRKTMPKPMQPSKVSSTTAQSLPRLSF